MKSKAPEVHYHQRKDDMKLKKNLDVSTQDFWYDLTSGGYINPVEICESDSDALSVIAAMSVIEDFENSCKDQIDGFIQ